MLKGNADDLDLKAYAADLIPQIKEKLKNVITANPAGDIEQLDSDIVNIHYPVLNFPEKISSFNFDKTPQVSGTLMGIKGQYLLFDTGVINIRKFTSYQISATYEG